MTISTFAGRQPLPVAMAVFVILGTGVVHGVRTDRWGTSEALVRACDRLRDVPLDLGPWRGKDLELAAEAIAIGEISDYVLRRYVHAETGNAVTMVLVCGRPGPISVHPPTVCYRGAGYQIVEAPRRCAFPAGRHGAGHEFLVAAFQQQTAFDGGRMRVFWGWSADGRWSAPENPRLEFARHAALYKLYVTQEVASSADPIEGSDAEAFLSEMLGALEKALADEDGPPADASRPPVSAGVPAGSGP